MTEDRLTLVRELSRSGVATVWEAWDTGLNRKVLVKSIHPQFARDADLRIRFEREARAIARLSHPNVVQIYDIQSGDDWLSLLLEFVEGETLGSLLKRRGVLPLPVALRIIAEILEGLGQAHAAGIIHRDLKPDNILISKNGAVKITDFGLASLRDLPGVTMEGAVVGTPSYMSPEQALGGEIGAQADLFTCGAMFFEMLTGQRLIPGESLGEAFQNVMKYRPPDLSTYSALIPANLLPVLASLLERDPSRRPQNADELRKQLIVKSPEPPAEQGGLVSFSEGTDWARPAHEILIKAGKHSRWWAYAGALTLTIALFAIWGWLREQPVEPLTSALQQPADTSTAATQQRDTSTVAPATSSVRDTTPVVPVPSTRDTVRPRPFDPVPAKLSGPAYATIMTKPWARVFYNDSLVGTTPLAKVIKLPSGPGTLLFMNDEIKLPVTHRVDLAPNDTLNLSLNLEESLGRIKIASVRPWADVYVDGELKFRTPSAQVIFVSLGMHTLELRHPNLPWHRQELIFEAGDPIYEARVDLTQM